MITTFDYVVIIFLGGHYMADKKQLSIGRLCLQIALAALLIIGGIYAFRGAADFGSLALKEVFILTILTYVFGAIEIIVGVFLIVEIFAGDILGNFGKILKIIIAVMWLIVIVLADILGAGGMLMAHFSLPSIYAFAQHLIVLGAMLCMF